MESEIIYLNLEKILDDWDPIGILQDFKPIDYKRGLIGEYSNYVKPLIETYFFNRSVFDYLIELQTDLFDVPNEEMKKDIEFYSNQINIFLSKLTNDELKKCL